MLAPQLEPTVRPSDLSQILDTHPDVRLLDVRTHGEYSAAHIRGAYSVPLHALGEHAAQICAIDTPVVLICQSGQRAMLLARLPYNRGGSCDTAAMVRALRDGVTPPIAL
jgi:rhodanese-related sulfurtransferase